MPRQEALDSKGHGAVHLAAWAGHAEVLRLLFTEGDAESTWRLALQQRHQEVLRVLLELKAPVA